MATTTQAPQLANYAYFSSPPKLLSGTQWVINDSYTVSPNGTVNISILSPTSVDLAVVGANGSRRAETSPAPCRFPIRALHARRLGHHVYLGLHRGRPGLREASCERCARSTQHVHNAGLARADASEQRPVEPREAHHKRHERLLRDLLQVRKVQPQDRRKLRVQPVQVRQHRADNAVQLDARVLVLLPERGRSCTFVQSSIANVFAVGKNSSNVINYYLSTGGSPSSWNFVNNVTYTPNSALYNSWCHIALQWVSATGPMRWRLCSSMARWRILARLRTARTWTPRRSRPGSWAAQRHPGSRGRAPPVQRGGTRAPFSMPTAQFVWDSSTINLQHCENFSLGLSEDANLVSAGVASTTYKRGGVRPPTGACSCTPWPARPWGTRRTQRLHPLQPRHERGQLSRGPANRLLCELQHPHAVLPALPRVAWRARARTPASGWATWTAACRACSTR